MEKTVGAKFTEYIVDTADSAAWIFEDLLAGIDEAGSVESFVADAVAEYKTWLEGAIEYIRENGI